MTTTTANATMTAQEAYEIALNDPIARIVNKSSLEDSIKTSPQYAYNYALNVIKGRWIDGEDIIKTNTHFAYNYAACVIKNRWIEGLLMGKIQESTFSMMLPVF